VRAARVPDRAAWHERRVLWSANPGLGALVTVARHLPPVARVPRLGWLVSDPELIRTVLVDHRSTTLVDEGGVGHLWAQLLGDWVLEAFDGAGHHGLRTRSRDLFTTAKVDALVAAAGDPVLVPAREALQRGESVDVADAARVLVGRMVVELLGLHAAGFLERANARGHDRGDGHDPYRFVFERGEELAALAIGTTADTHLDPAVVARGRGLLEELTAAVPETFRHAPEDTILGRCRVLGLSEQEATGLASLLLVAGTGTAASAMTRTTALLADTGAVQRLAAVSGSEREALLEVAVREGLRVTTPAPVIGRHVTREVLVGRHTLRPGDRVLNLTYVANTGPGGLDLDRPYLPEQRQLWFGAGRHLCLGAPLARAELTAFLTTLLSAGPWEVVRRVPARRVLIPTYGELVVRAVRD
jgi:cytochrome P450